MRSVQSKIVIGLYGIVAVSMVATYFRYYPIPGFFGRLWEGALAVLLAAFSTGSGRAILRWTGSDGRTTIEERGWIETVLLSFAVGLIPFSLGLLILGTSGFYSPTPIAIFTLAWGALGAGEWRRAIRAVDKGELTIPPTLMLGWGVKATAAVVFILGLLVALAPPTYYDSLVYHLALPLRYLQEGKIGFVPYNQYGHFPQNLELIFGWFLAAGSDVSAHLFNLFFGVATGALVWVMGRGQEKRWDLLLFLTAPCVLMLSTETYVEMPLAFYTVLAVWAADRGVREQNRAWLVVAGCAGGFAAGIKYTGVMTPALLSGLIVCWPGPRSIRDRLLDGACVALPSFALFVPWMVKNFYFTGGNPVFPFLPSIFPAKNVYMFEESAKAYFEVLAEYKGKSNLLIELFQMPFRLIKNPQSFGGGYDVTGDMGWALPLLLVPLSVLTFKRGRSFLISYAVAHVMVWASLRPVLRFLFPIFPLVCLLAGEGAGVVWKEAGPWVRRVGAIVFGLFVVSNGILFYIFEEVRGPLPASLGLLSRSEYLSKKLDYYPAMEFMKQNLPENANVLFVGDQRAYYCPRRHLAPMGLLPTPLRPWTDDSPDGPAFVQKLKGMGLTHIFFNFKEAKRLEGYRVLDLSDHGKNVFYSGLKSLRPIHSTEGTVLLALPE